MPASWKVFTRDLSRILRKPKVWLIVVGVMIIPALYTWFNVAALWDPYDNTGDIDVAVVNEDEGGESDITGPLDVGSQLVDQLKENDQLGWTFMDSDEADDALKGGDIYATIEVPPTFTGDLLSMVEGTYSQPTLTYRVNEKQNAISPQITDQGATTLDSTINSVAKEQITEAVTTEIRNASGDLTDNLDGAQDDTADAFDGLAETMSDARGSVTRIQGGIERAGPTITATQDTLRSVDTTLGTAQTALGEVQSIMTEVQEQIAGFSDAATTAYLEGTSALADATSSANSAISSATGELERAGASIDTATRDASGALRQGERAIGQLQDLLDGAAVTPAVAQPLQDALDDLEERNSTNRQLLDNLETLQGDASGAVGVVEEAADALERATSNSREEAQGMQSSASDSLPDLNGAISRVSATAGNFSGALGSTQTLLQESVGLLDGVGGTLEESDGVLENFKGELTGIEDGLETARADVLALNATSEGGLLDTVNNLDSVGISQFMATPAEVDSHSVYPVGNYGSGMSALFTNLTLWIGAFMLMLIFRTEVDTEGFKKLTVGQAYRGRLLLLATLGVCQALVVSVGNLVIGVQTVNPFIFVGTSVLIGLSYLTIVYGLISTLGHVGRVIAVVLVFLQIPGASGMYPIEMTPGFFQAISPFLPFTYGIDALRETVGGFYGNHYWKAMGVLAGMALVALVAGTLLRRWMSNVNLLVNRQLDSGGLVVSEDVQVVGSSYRLTDMIHALRDRDAYREEIDQRWKPLRDNYPRLLKLAVIVGVAGVLILGVIARLFTENKPLIFGLFCLWCLLVVGFIAGLEYIKQSFAHAQELSDLPDDELQAAMATQGSRSLEDPEVSDGPDEPGEPGESVEPDGKGGES
ncbi:MAG: YhgE/Pip family protein [Corynebacterium sp.]|uniref:YhgE/Pip domain-containing protein n=1 Tax=Corynebacterium sp. TaxID=1720 RepID=UPI003F9D7C35